MIIDVAKIDQQLQFLQREISRLVEIDSPWANKNAATLQEIAENAPPVTPGEANDWRLR